MDLVTAIHHVALRVDDVERSVTFYSGLLGLPVVRPAQAAGGSVWLGAGGTILMLERNVRGQGRPDGSGHVLALAVADLFAWGRHLEERGIPVTDRTDFTLYLTDPDGHRVGLTIFPHLGDGFASPGAKGTVHSPEPNRES